MKRRSSWKLPCLFTVFLVLVAGAGAGEPAAVQGAAARKLYFPPAEGSWEKVQAAESGWDLVKLKAALELAGRRKSSAVVILYQGRLLAEQYWEVPAKPRDEKGRLNRYFYLRHGKGAGGRIIEDIASAQKSIVSLLVGIAGQKGLLKLSDPVDKHLGAGWSKAPREKEKKITLRHLITMSSGLKIDLGYEAPAGTKWKYNTPAYSHSLQAVAAASGMSPDELTKKWLSGPLGMVDSRWIDRRLKRIEAVTGVKQKKANTLGFATTARDLARVGLMVLAGGTWNGKVIVSDKAYLADSVKPSQKMNPAYGYLWWLNSSARPVASNGQRRSRTLVPSAPSDLFAAQGALGRRLWVAPSLGIVATRLGDDPRSSGQGDFDRLFWKALVEAIPKAGAGSRPKD